ncbi:MAG: peptide chain release factor N(5)-glutamine methyltransferase [Planctomycetota bacterium]
MSSDAPWTIQRLLTWTTEHFASRGIDSARLEAEVLLAHARGCKRIELYTVFDEVPPADLRDRFKALVQRRGEGEPVAYVVGEKEFYSLPFEVTPSVLIPRPESELLVVTLTDRVKAAGDAGRTLKIADVGTGSGMLAICAAKYVENANVLATDVSPEALEVAKRNAERHGVADRTFFVEADLFPANKPAMGLDYIVSNPPYITTSELAELDSIVRDHEPTTALDGGPEGTTIIERLLPAAAQQLRPEGVLLMEVSPMIAPRVERLVESTEGLELRPTIKDLAGHARVIEVALARL